MFRNRSLRQLWANQSVNYGLLIFFTLSGSILPAAFFPQVTEMIIPVILGIIAAALAENDDKLSGRLKSISLTLICFAVASFSIEILFPTPVLFAIGLFASTFTFIMLGAIGPRYASIAFGSLLIAIYTMLGAQHSENLWLQPMLLIGGALWYYLLSMIWYLVWPQQPVQQNLSNVFLQLAQYLDSKSELFYPVSELTPQPLRIEEAKLNAATVQALNVSKTTLLNRSNKGHVDSASDRFLNLYFLAQDIHERVSSSHYRYQELATEFARSDILFRFKYLLECQAQACRNIAESIKLGKEYKHDNKSVLALDELRSSLSHLNSVNNPKWRLPAAQLGYLFNNLMTVEKQLNNVNNPDANQLEENVLFDTEVHTLGAMWQRIKSNFSPRSLLFRHAIRMSVALTLGYGIIQMFNIEMGYWILLTTLFVCQPNYSATRHKLVARIAGTLAGLLIGVPLLTILSSVESQLAVITATGIAFFIFRQANYGYATGFITILVLFCFHQLGAGYAVVLPRLIDTLIGCVLAAGAVTLILPDWQSRKIHAVMAEAISANRHYLLQIIGQYRVGKKDNLAYRVARRDAHNQDATLSNAISNMLAEPGRYRRSVDECFRFLTLNHALLSYISALGAHRTRLDHESTHQLVLDAHRIINQHLDLLSNALEQQTDLIEGCSAFDNELEKRLSEWRDEDDGSVRMVLQQLHLIYRMLPELHSLSNKFAARSSLTLT